MSLSADERQWLLDRAWTCLQYQQASHACVLLGCLMELRPDDLQAEKMLLVALLDAMKFQDVVTAANRLLEKQLLPKEEAAVYWCLFQALLELGEHQLAREAHQNYQASLHDGSTEAR